MSADNVKSRIPEDVVSDKKAAECDDVKITPEMIEGPLHDWSSHAADAARTGAMGLDESEPIDMSKCNPLAARRRRAYQPHNWMAV